MSWPGIPAWLMHDATTYVVDADLRELPPQLAKRFASLLQQVRRRDVKKSLRRAWLSPVQMALLHVHALFSGLKPDGVGLNVSARAWARRLGCKERAVTKAFARLKKLGLLQRWPRLVPHAWVDGKKKRERADVDGVSYVTPAGLEWLREREPRIRREVVLSTWKPGGVQRAVVLAAGLFGRLLETMRSKLRRVAARLLPSAKQDRPTAEERNQKLQQPNERATGPRPFPTRPRPRSLSLAALKGARRSDDERRRIRTLYDERRLTPGTAWPARWAKALRERDRGEWQGFWWCVRECERWVRRFEDETNATERTQPPAFRGRGPGGLEPVSDKPGPTVQRKNPKRKFRPDPERERQREHERVRREHRHNWREYES